MGFFTIVYMYRLTVTVPINGISDKTVYKFIVEIILNRGEN